MTRALAKSVFQLVPIFLQMQGGGHRHSDGVVLQGGAQHASVSCRPTRHVRGRHRRNDGEADREQRRDRVSPHRSSCNTNGNWSRHDRRCRGPKQLCGPAPPERNPFDVMDVPNPNDREVLNFAAGVTLTNLGR